MIWLLSACTEIFDISSTVLVYDASGYVVTQSDVEFCQRLNTDYTSKEVEEYSVDACTTVTVENGVADLPNWEGEYRGTVQSVELFWMETEEIAPLAATLIDSDRDVWCDNVDVDTDMQGNTTSTPFCTSNYEFYLLWELQLPSD